MIALASPGAALVATQFADRFERKWQLSGSALAIAVFGLCFSQQRGAAGIVVFGLLIAFSNTVRADFPPPKAKFETNLHERENAKKPCAVEALSEGRIVLPKRPAAARPEASNG